jgi:hypothetical protein
MCQVIGLGGAAANLRQNIYESDAPRAPRSSAANVRPTIPTALATATARFAAAVLVSGVVVLVVGGE